VKGLFVKDSNGQYRAACSKEILYVAEGILERKLSKGDVFSGSNAAGRFLSCKLRERKAEVFAVMFLDIQRRLIEFREMFHGTIDGANVYPREVVRAALETNAAAVILAHNHPSGEAEASSADEQITQRLKEALDLIDVQVLDHLIVGNGTVTSMAQRLNGA
jgi:DNA repair protein RadC